MLETTPTPTAASDASGHLRPWRPGPRVRLGVSLGSLAVLVVVGAQWARGLYGDAHTIAGRYDFSTYYAAAYALRHNLHADIYSQTVLTQAGAAGHVMVQPPLAYTYPPLFAVLLSPFTLLSFKLLSRLWLFGNAALWLAITVVLAREIADLLRPVLPSPLSDAPARAGNGSATAPSTGRHLQRPPAQPGLPTFLARGRAEAPAGRVRALLDDPRPLLALGLGAWLCLTFVPAVQTLLTGQINLLVLAPLALVPLLLRRGHDRWAGAAIGVSAILKFTPALLIVYLLLRRRWQAAAAAAMTLAGLFVLSALVVGPGVAAASLGQALQVGTGDATLGHNQALFAPLLLFTSLHAPAQLATATLLARLALVLLALAFGYVIWRLPRASGRDREPAPSFTVADAVAYGLALCALLLLSPTAWVHHYVWVLPAAAIALGLATARLLGSLGTRRLAAAIVALALVVVACAALGVSLPYDWDTDPHPAITHAGLLVWPLALLLRPVATVALAGLLVFLGRPPGGASQSSEAPAAHADSLPLAPQGEGAGG